MKIGDVALAAAAAGGGVVVVASVVVVVLLVLVLVLLCIPEVSPSTSFSLACRAIDSATKSSCKWSSASSISAATSSTSSA